jgi:hypothetical protein
MDNKKKYKVIAKVENEKFVKYNVNNLLKFVEFLDTNFVDWRWFNVYNYVPGGKGMQLANFTTKSRPTKRFI